MEAIVDFLNVLMMNYSSPPPYIIMELGEEVKHHTV